MFDTIEQARLGELHFKSDPASSLQAIIAIHNTRLGPALGGCRCVHYATDQDAINDAIKLARGMSYKAALAGLPQGGGKAVIIKPRGDFQRQDLYRAFGKFVNELGGRYITAVDSGTSLQDMDYVSQITPHVAGSLRDGLDPSPCTALGVFAGIQAAARHQFGNADLRGRTVAIQGVGNVGYALAQLLSQAGARLLVCDTDPLKVKQAVAEFHAEPMAPEQFTATHCDILAPCGLGGVIDRRSIEDLRCAIIAGSANNQLAEPDLGQRLHAKGILYAPDYVLNAGGLIQVALGVRHTDAASIQQRILAIGDTLTTIFDRSRATDTPPSTTADQMAEAILYGNSTGA